MTALFDPTKPTARATALLLLAGLCWGAGLLGLTLNAVQAAAVTEEMLKARVRAHVQEQLKTLFNDTNGKASGKDDHAQIEVEIMRVPSAPFAFPQAKTIEELRISLTSTLDTNYSERSIVRVHLEDANGSSREIGVPVHIVIKKPVWVVKNAINANSPLRFSDVSLEVRDVSHNYRYAVGQEKALGHYSARVNLQPGDVLDSRKIIIPPDVRCNNTVRILISNGNGMTLSIPGVALADGRIGDTIRVRQSLYQRKYHMAKIIDKNQVLVEI